jgi:hypothetical protein
LYHLQVQNSSHQHLTMETHSLWQLHTDTTDRLRRLQCILSPWNLQIMYRQLLCLQLSHLIYNVTSFMCDILN